MRPGRYVKSSPGLLGVELDQYPLQKHQGIAVVVSRSGTSCVLRGKETNGVVGMLG